jgi:hypothetical protein
MLDNTDGDRSKRSVSIGRHPSITFLRLFHAGEKWRLTAIKDGSIKSRTFDGADREERAVEWIDRLERSGADIYFSPNPVVCADSVVKASKKDVAAAAWLWSDIDPPKAATAEEVEAWRQGKLVEFKAGHLTGSRLPRSTSTAAGGSGASGGSTVRSRWMAPAGS